MGTGLKQQSLHLDLPVVFGGPRGIVSRLTTLGWGRVSSRPPHARTSTSSELSEERRQVGLVRVGTGGSGDQRGGAHDGE